MKGFLKKLGKQAASLFILAAVLVMPMAVGAAIDTSDMTSNLQSTAQAGGIEGSTTDLPTLVGNIIKVVIGLLGVLLVIFIVYAGFLWMTAAGDKDKVGKAQKIIYQSVIGLVIIFAAYAIASFVIDQLTTVAG